MRNGIGFIRLYCYTIMLLYYCTGILLYGHSVLDGTFAIIHVRRHVLGDDNFGRHLQR
jgi:hypothetical protein